MPRTSPSVLTSNEGLSFVNAGTKESWRESDTDPEVVRQKRWWEVFGVASAEQISESVLLEALFYLRVPSARVRDSDLTNLSRALANGIRGKARGEGGELEKKSKPSIFRVTKAEAAKRLKFWAEYKYGLASASSAASYMVQAFLVGLIGLPGLAGSHLHPWKPFHNKVSYGVLSDMTFVYTLCFPLPPLSFLPPPPHPPTPPLKSLSPPLPPKVASTLLLRCLNFLYTPLYVVAVGATAAVFALNLVSTTSDVSTAFGVVESVWAPFSLLICWVCWVCPFRARRLIAS